VQGILNKISTKEKRKEGFVDVKEIKPRPTSEEESQDCGEHNV